MKEKAYHLVLIIILLICQNGIACFCVSEEIGTANYSAYEELFLGKVLNIKRIEITETREKEKYNLVGTITTFEIIKKWKGSSNKVIEIYQQQNSCGIDFSITNSRWIISAYRKSFVTESFRKEYPSKYLQTDNCSLYIEELDYGEFENDIEKIDKMFPKGVKLRDSSKNWIWVIISILGLGIIIGLKMRKKRTDNNV